MKIIVFILLLSLLTVSIQLNLKATTSALESESVSAKALTTAKVLKLIKLRQKEQLIWTKYL